MEIERLLPDGYLRLSTFPLLASMKVPQGLKPGVFSIIYGPTKVVP